MSQPDHRKLPLAMAAIAACLGLPAPVAAATWTVTATTDTVPGTPVGTGAGSNSGTTDLRYAIAQANLGSGDSIVFNCGTPCEITLGGPLPVIKASMTINGGGNLTINGSNLYRAFFVESGTVAISNLTVKNVKAQGGNGGDAAANGAGGGGAGLGAGLFNYGGTVTLSKVAFVNPAVVGGNGGNHASGFGGAGGGGGLGGNGGAGYAGSNGAGGGGGGALPGADGGAGTQLAGGVGGAYGGGGGGAGLIGGMTPNFGSAGGGGANAYVGTSTGSGGTTAASSPFSAVGGSGGFGGGPGGVGAGSAGGNAGVAGYGGGGGGSSNGGAGTGGGGGGGRTSGSKAGADVVVLDATATPTVTLAGGTGQGGGGGGAAGGPAVFVYGGAVTTIATTSTGQTATAGDPGTSSASPARPGLAASTNNTGGNTYVGADATPLLNAGGTVNNSGTTGALPDAIPAPTNNLTVTTAGTGSGRVISSFGGINCAGGTGTCSAVFDSFDDTIVTTVVLTATAATGSTFDGWSGTCGSGSGTLSVAMTRDRACTATFITSGAGGSSSAPSMPAAPPPAFVVAPVAPVINIPAIGTGSGQLSLASSFISGTPLTFDIKQADGTPLPNWIIFNPSTISFTFNPPLPLSLPYLPLTIAPGFDRAAAAVPPNAIYSPAIRIARVPVAIAATAAGQTYSVTVLMDFFAPRVPVSVSALSLGLDGALGNGAAGATALSWDGGQAVFATAASNLFAAAVNSFPDIDRYDGVSGIRDRLSQTAIPGGGVANTAAGLSTSPAVAAGGAYAAFASDAPGISATFTPGRQRQVYRIALGYPRIALNEAATPAPLLASATAAGIAGNGPSDHPALSQDGRYVAFDSTATNLADGLDGTARVWRKDLTTGELSLVGSGTNPSISWDGRFVAFESKDQVLLRDMTAGTVKTVAVGNAPRLTARADRVVFATTATGPASVAYADLASGTVRQVAEGDQPDISADGRFVVWRAAGGGFSQIWVRDLTRGVTALVSRSSAGQPAAGDSQLPRVSGDGSTIAFASGATDIVRGPSTAAQAYVAANPLPLPDRTGYWYMPAVARGQGWAMERWGNRTYVGALVYDAAGQPGWTAGICTSDGLDCRGSLVPFTGGAVFGAASGPAPVPGPATAFTLTSAADGRSATLQVGNAAAQTLSPYPIGGSATSAYPGLPQAGWWIETGSTGGNGYFLDIDTQAADGTVVQAAHVSVLTFDAAGQPVWYAAQANLGADFSFSGTLSQYAAGSGATPTGPLRLTFQGTDRATAVLPNGRTAQLQRWRF